MRLVSFRSGGDVRAGIESDGTVVELEMDPMEAIELLPNIPPRAARARQHRLDELDLLAPVPRPGKVIGIGMNYLDHCREQGIEPPAQPQIFAKFNTSVVGPGSPIWWPAGVTEAVDWEVELAVVMGANGRVAGFTVANDVSARDIQLRDGQLVRGKSLDSFCPMGPALVSADDLPDPCNLRLWLDRNGKREQESNTSNLIFNVAQLVDFCRAGFTLEPGDVILTGTPPGVGAFRHPPEYLREGDVMAAGIEHIGLLQSPVEGPRH